MSVPVRSAVMIVLKAPAPPMRYGMLGLAPSPRPRAVLAVRYPPDQAGRRSGSLYSDCFSLNNVIPCQGAAFTPGSCSRLRVPLNPHSVGVDEDGLWDSLAWRLRAGFYALIVDFDHNVAKGDPA